MNLEYIEKIKNEFNFDININDKKVLYEEIKNKIQLEYNIGYIDSLISYYEEYKLDNSTIDNAMSILFSNKKLINYYLKKNKNYYCDFMINYIFNNIEDECSEILIDEIIVYTLEYLENIFGINELIRKIEEIYTYCDQKFRYIEDDNEFYQSLNKNIKKYLKFNEETYIKKEGLNFKFDIIQLTDKTIFYICLNEKNEIKKFNIKFSKIDRENIKIIKVYYDEYKNDYLIEVETKDKKIYISHLVQE